MSSNNDRFIRTKVIKELADLLQVDPILFDDATIERKLSLLKTIQIGGGLDHVLFRVLDYLNEQYSVEVVLCCPTANIPYLYKGFRFSIWTHFKSRKTRSEFEVDKRLKPLSANSFIKRISGPKEFYYTTQPETLKDLFDVKRWLHLRLIKKIESQILESLQKRLPSGAAEHKLVLQFLQNVEYPISNEEFQLYENRHLGGKEFSSLYQSSVSLANRFALTDATDQCSFGFQLLLLRTNDHGFTKEDQMALKAVKSVLEILIEVNSLEGNFGVEEKENKTVDAAKL